MTRRFTWPWGRISPEKRLEEIERIIRKHKANIRILEAQTKEAIRLHEKSIAALMEQQSIVAGFLDEDLRKRTMEEAFELMARGVDVLDKVEAAKSLEEIQDILEQARQNIPAENLEIVKKAPNSDAGARLDFFDDIEDSIDDIFGKKG